MECHWENYLISF